MIQLICLIYFTAGSHKNKRKEIKTWVKLANDDCYTHTSTEWFAKAWFHSKIENGRLTFNIEHPTKATLTKKDYAYYHGHLAETFLNHFDEDFDDIEITALPDSDDSIK